MTISEHPARIPRWLLPLIIGVVLALAAAGVAVAALALRPTSPSDGGSGADTGGSDGVLSGFFSTAPGADDGVLPEGAGVFDTEQPGVGNLRPELLEALQRAAQDAEAEQIRFVVNSGWRSPDYQDELLREAVSEYGSAVEASRWVASADRSLHVSGDAVDIGQLDATLWLSEHGAAYGLCQVYANESWHFELQPEAPTVGCAAPYLDPTQDPRTAG